MYTMYAEYSALIDTALVTALAVIVWAAYRETRRRKKTRRSGDRAQSQAS